MALKNPRRASLIAAGLVVAILALGISGCAVEPVGVQSTGNASLSVDVIGRDEDGYTIKRFRDGSYDRYYVTPGPATVNSGHTVQSGKTSYYVPEEVATTR